MIRVGVKDRDFDFGIWRLRRWEMKKPTNSRQVLCEIEIVKENSPTNKMSDSWWRARMIGGVVASPSNEMVHNFFFLFFLGFVALNGKMDDS